VKGFFSSPPRQYWLWDPSSFLSNGYRELIPVCIADHLLLSSTRAKNTWNYISTHPYVFIVLDLVKHRPPLTFIVNRNINLICIRVWNKRANLNNKNISRFCNLRVEVDRCNEGRVTLQSVMLWQLFCWSKNLRSVLVPQTVQGLIPCLVQDGSSCSAWAEEVCTTWHRRLKSSVVPAVDVWFPVLSYLLKNLTTECVSVTVTHLGSTGFEHSVFLDFTQCFKARAGIVP